MKDIETVWMRIKKLEGQQLETKTGKAFTFDVSGNVIHPSRTNYNIAKSEVKKALNHVPFEGPGAINQIVRGPAYLWAILHHPSVRRDDW